MSANQRGTLAGFIEKARLKHGARYGYDKVFYVNNHTPVILLCFEHGEFSQTPAAHTNSGHGCLKCGRRRIEDARRTTLQKFLDQAKRVHGDAYSYAKAIYITGHRKVVLTCPSHGDFTQTPNSHLCGSGCPQCRDIRLSHRFRKPCTSFIEDAQQIHGATRYDYSKVIYVNAKTRVVIGCNIHGGFEQIPDSHLAGNGCPTCSESQGEKRVALVLQQLGVDIDREFSLPDCRDRRPLPFDFCIWGADGFPQFIEFQGQQHYEPWSPRRGKPFRYDCEKLQRHDGIKAAFCKRMNIPLLCISYKDVDRILELVKEFLNARALGAAA